MIKVKKTISFFLIVFFLAISMCGLIFFVPSVTANAADTNKREMKDILGVTNSGGYYAFDSTVSCMEDGANKVKAMGSDVLKLWLSEQYNECYPFNTNWDRFEITSCVDLLKTDIYQKTLEMDFSTFILEVYSFDYKAKVVVDWADGTVDKDGNPNFDAMSDAEKAQLEDEMYQITKYLMLQYNGSGKKFVLQNWEGDNLFDVRRWRFDSESGYYYEAANGKSSANKATTAIVENRIRGLTDWFNSRQKGVDKAMQELADISDVNVRHALEINFTCIDGDGEWPYADTPYLLKTIVPYTDCDLYSYSCWSSQNLARAYTLDERLKKYDETVGTTYKDIYDNNLVKARRPFAREGQTTKVMLGEYGGPERLQKDEAGSGFASEMSFEIDRRQRQVVQIQTEIALNHNLEYIVFWEMYCNVPMPGTTINTMNGEQAEDNLLMQGSWLIRCDGTYTETYKYFNGLLDPTSLLVNKDYSANEIYSLNESCGGIEVSATMTTNTYPSNIGNRGYDNAVIVKASKDGETYVNVPLIGYYDKVIEKNNKFISNVKFINTQEMDSGYRYFKVASNRGESELTVNAVKLYKPEKQRLLKLKVSGKINDEVQSGSKYVVGSDVTLKLIPRVTDSSFAGEYHFSTSNRYIASVSTDGEVLGRTSGIAKITVTATGGNLVEPLIQVVDVTVKVDGEVIITDSFTNIETIAFRNNETKNPNEKEPGFGTHKFLPAKGETPAGEQKFLETENIQFFTLNPAFTSIIEAYDNDPFNAYVLDWEIPSGHIIYEAEEDIGGYQLGLGSYGQNGLDRVEVFVSKDNKDYKKINSFVSESSDATLGYYKLIISNRQVIPEGMRFIKFKITYTSANKWNPQMFGIKVLGAPVINSKYVDIVDPTIKVDGTYQTSANLGDEIKLLPATYSDDFATNEEMLKSTRVFLTLEGTNMEIEVKDNKFIASAVGEYKIVYTCEDLAGNLGKQEYVLNVSEKKEKKGCGSASILSTNNGIPIIGIILASGLLLAIITKKRKANNHFEKL